MSAIARTNELKPLRQAVKDRLGAAQDVAEARGMLAGLIEDSPKLVQSMTVFALLCAGRGIGTGRANRYLQRIGASQLRRVGELSERQRERIVRELRS